MADVVAPDQLEEFAADAAAGRRVLVGRGQSTFVFPERRLFGVEPAPPRRRREPLGKIAPSAIARALDQNFPGEVFDLKKNTLAIEFSIYRDVRVGPITTKPATKNKGGRPPIINWDEFWIEVALYAALNDLEEKHRAELQSRLVDFCERRWGDGAPEPRTISDKLTKLYKRRRRAET